MASKHTEPLVDAFECPMHQMDMQEKPPSRASSVVPTLGVSTQNLLASLDPDIVPLQPFVGLCEHLRSMFSCSRVIVLLICGLICGLGMSFVDPLSFRMDVVIHDIQSLEGCKHYCTRSLTDPDFHLPGTGHCVNKKNQSLVKYELCHRKNEAELDTSRCWTVTDDSEKAPDNGMYSTRCTIPVIPGFWKPYAAVSVFAFAITLVIQGCSAELLLLGAACILCIMRVIEPEDVFAGLSNEGVCGLAVLFPIAEAVGETGMLEKAIGVLLGTPQGLASAVPRLMLPVALLSALLSNTATVAMMIPITVSWARRLDVHPGKLLMPLSFAAQLGGSCTLLGSSHVLVAKTSVPSNLYNMGFFDLTGIGAIICVITGVFITFLARTPLLKPSLADEEDSADGAVAQDVYEVHVFVTPYGGLTRCSLEDSGLRRLKGVADVRRVAEDRNEVIEPTLQVGEELVIEATEIGIMFVRSHPGLKLENQDELSLLGAGRSTRRLYEVTIRAGEGSTLRSFANIQIPMKLREELGACVVAGPKAPAGGRRQIRPGSVMLLEADRRYPGGVKAEAWSGAFAIIRQIPNSAPPRMNTKIDTCRNIVTCLGMLALIALVTLEYVNIAYGGFALLMFYVFIRAITVEQMMSAVRGSILLIIAGALAMASALTKTGVVHFVAVKLMAAAEPMGFVGVIGMVYIISVALSMFINNSATIAILSPMVVSMSETLSENKDDQKHQLKLLVWTLVLGAGSCFTTPLGYQTNLMVMPDGKYSFGDFARFGGLIQLLHGVAVVFFIFFLGDFL